MQIQVASSYPNLDKRVSFAAHAAAVHLLLSIATKVGKNAFAAESRRLAKTESFNQRKVGFLTYALRRQFGGFNFITV